MWELLESSAGQLVAYFAMAVLGVLAGVKMRRRK